jgi:hypothetical protein
MIADPALMCQASLAIFLKRLVQSVAPAGEDLHGSIPEMDLDPVAVEPDLVNPARPGRHLLDRCRQRRFDEIGHPRLDPDHRRFLALERHRQTRRMGSGS